MIVTDSFVLLNLPKTGSSFARTVLKEIYEQRGEKLEELLLPNIKVEPAGPADQHGTYSQIPEEYRDREVVSIVRNPFDRIISGYEFRWWASHPEPEVAQQFPNFPELSLDEWLHYMELARVRQIPYVASDRIGIQTIQFIQMFFRNPREVLTNITDEYVDSDRVFDDLADVVFLRSEGLNEQLAAYLAGKGFSDAEAEYIRSREPVNVTERSAADRSGLWTPTARAYVEHRDRLVFRTLGYPRAAAVAAA